MMKTVLITGSTDGIGKKAAALFLNAGYKVIVHARNKARLEETLTDLKPYSRSNSPLGVVADFTRLEEVRRMIADLHEMCMWPNIIVNNAAVFNTRHQLNPDGFEETFLINYLAAYYLTRLLLDGAILSETRIVNVSSMAQAGTIDFNNLMGEKRFDPYEAYALSKLANVLFTYKLYREYENTGLVTLCLHPGVINTKLLRTGWGGGGSATEEGAERLFYAATATPVSEVNGQYLVNIRVARSVAISYDQRVQDVLWNKSAVLLGMQSK